MDLGGKGSERLTTERAEWQRERRYYARIREIESVIQSLLADKLTFEGPMEGYGHYEFLLEPTLRAPVASLYKRALLPGEVYSNLPFIIKERKNSASKSRVL